MGTIPLCLSPQLLGTVNIQGEVESRYQAILELEQNINVREMEMCKQHLDLFVCCVWCVHIYVCVCVVGCVVFVCVVWCVCVLCVVGCGVCCVCVHVCCVVCVVCVCVCVRAILGTERHVFRLGNAGG